MITYSDDGPEFEPDDPLAVILRPASDRLGPPPGRYEEIRRGAARRRLVRAAVWAGTGLTCAVAALVVLLPQSSPPGDPVSPSVPLAPPPVSSPSVAPTPSVSSEPAEVHPSPRAPTDGPGTPVTEVAPVPGPK
ncbi:hypothetical protein [Streptomyces sp. NPDC014676]|uniref:hypothetical protein n=1 Tax=Streptomyces sp. NPDC014676 TaxID=3364879 RepID=UPI0036FA6711